MAAVAVGGARVPFGRRTLLADRKRSALSAAGVGLALMLVLLLYGIWNGIDDRLVAFEDHAGAALYVAQPGTTSMLSEVSVLPRSTVATVTADPGVRWAVPVRGFFSVTHVGDTRVPTYVVGTEPGRPGGPWELAAGRAPAADDEVTVGQLFARRAGVAPGSRLSILGAEFTVVGIARDADMFMASFAFMTHAATDRLVHSDATTSFVLVGTDEPAAVQARLAAAGLNVLTRDQIAANDQALKSQAYTAGMKAMLVVAFGIGALVVALTTYTGVVERRREYGIVKALGATKPRLLGIVVGQSVVLAGLGLIVGVVLYGAGRRALEAVRPEYAVSLSPGALLRTAVAAILMGLVASAVPAHRLAAIEPAVAFGGG